MNEKTNTSPSSESEVQAIRARLSFRIHGLVNRGTEICAAYVVPVEGDICCARCGYRDDVHLLRDTLALVDQLQREQARLREDVAAAAGELRVPLPEPGSDAARMLIANRLLKADVATLRDALDQVRSIMRHAEGQRDVLRAEVEKLTRELAEARDWSDTVTRGKSPCGHWKCYAHTEDGGKLIQCWQCRAEATEAKLTEAQRVQQEQRRKDFMSGVDVCADGMCGVGVPPPTMAERVAWCNAYLAQPPAPEPEKETSLTSEQIDRMRSALKAIAAWDGEHPDEAGEWMLACAQAGLSKEPPHVD